MTNPLVPALFGIDPETPADVFNGYWDPTERWNGFATPSFTRAEVERIIAWVTRTAPDEESCDGFEWDGDTLVHIEADQMLEPGYEPERYTPFTEPGIDEPLYGLGSWGWCWQVVEIPEGVDPAVHLATETTRTDVYCTAANAALHAAYAAGATREEAGTAFEAAGRAAVAAWEANSGPQLVERDNTPPVLHDEQVHDGLTPATVRAHVDAHHDVDEFEVMREAVDAEGVVADGDDPLDVVLDDEAHTLMHMAPAARIARWVSWAKDMIRMAVDSGTIPRTVESFSDLHDWCDANDFLLHVPHYRTGDTARDIARASDILDEWIKGGALHTPTAR